jgi:hypothetical protein
MAIGAGGVAAITAGGALLSQGGSAYATGRMNRKNRAFAEHMYNRQREGAQADWNQTNEYNSPVEQMKRLTSLTNTRLRIPTTTYRSTPI